MFIKNFIERNKQDSIIQYVPSSYYLNTLFSFFQNYCSHSKAVTINSEVIYPLKIWNELSAPGQGMLLEKQISKGGEETLEGGNIT